MFTVTTDNTNKDIPSGMSRQQARDYYLNMYGDAVDSRLPDPITL